MKVETLREKYPEFVYKGFQSQFGGNDLDISFDFQISPDIKFKPSIKIKNVSEDLLNKLPEDALNNFIFHIGLAEIPSYWKSTCSPRIKIVSGHLDNYQTKWWKKLFFEGMGQFYWENKITADLDFVDIESSNKNYCEPYKLEESKTLIPVGGGKDSAVTLEILGKGIKTTGVFMLNPTPSSEKLAKIAGIEERIIVERSIDPKLLELNKQGYLNGHTPFSSYLAFLSIFSAAIYGYSEIAFSNERSSNEANTILNGSSINHQYSKTTEFESDFREYNKRYLSNIQYFSFLRPLHEIQIAKLFSEMPEYFNSFRSCNVGQKTNSWCENCSKCLSTYILLHPFLDQAQMGKIFSHDLFEDTSSYPLLEQLTRDDLVKPFECVGTRIELKASLALSAESLKKSGKALPILLRKAEADSLFSSSLASVANILLSDWNEENFLDKKSEGLLKAALAQK